jgi:sulfur carrier protein ThiS
MQVRVKLMGTLRGKMPADGKLEVPDEATVEQVLAQLAIASQQVQVVLINGRPERDKSCRLEPQDELTVLAPVGGG